MTLAPSSILTSGIQISGHCESPWMRYLSFELSKRFASLRCHSFSTGQWDPSRLPFRMPCIYQKYVNDKTKSCFLLPRPSNLLCLIWNRLYIELYTGSWRCCCKFFYYHHQLLLLLLGFLADYTATFVCVWVFLLLLSIYKSH